MVTNQFNRPFRQDESGIALSEALITFPIVILVFAVFFEFGFAMSQWNHTVKALQYGARRAVVSDPLVESGDFQDAFPAGATNPLNNGTATPNDATISVSCGYGYAPCDPTAFDRIVKGSDGKCRGETPDPYPGICDISPIIKPENLVVTYQRSGLGYWGRPEGPVLTLRLEVRNTPLPLLLLDDLLGATITMPAHPVTITTEDLKTCSTC